MNDTKIQRDVQFALMKDKFEAFKIQAGPEIFDNAQSNTYKDYQAAKM